MMLLYYLVGLVVVLSNTNCTKWYLDESLHLRGREAEEGKGKEERESVR